MSFFDIQAPIPAYPAPYDGHFYVDGSITFGVPAPFVIVSFAIILLPMISREFA
jgi:hypothetical protein